MMDRPTSPASVAPPEMTKRKLGKRDGIRWTITWLHRRAASMTDPKAAAILNSAAFSLGNEIREGRWPPIADGDDVARAAQPPEPTREFVHPVSGDTVVVSTETGRIVETRAQPPEPGDTERLAQYDASIGGCLLIGEHRVCWGPFLRRLLDAAQSALADLGQAYIVIQEHRDEMQSTLAESQERAENLEADAANDAAEIISLRSALAESREATKIWAEEQKRWAEKLAERTSELTASRQDNQTLVHDVTEWRERFRNVLAQREESRAEVVRLHDILQRGEDDLHATDQKLYKAMEELARLRSPAATGEDREAALNLITAIIGDWRSVAGTKINLTVDAIAAARARGLRDSPTATGEDREVADGICSWAVAGEYLAYSSAAFYPLRDKITVALAAARAQGAREGIETCAAYHDGEKKRHEGHIKECEALADDKSADCHRQDSYTHWRSAEHHRALAAPEPRDG